MATGVNWLENPEFASVIRIAAAVASDAIHDELQAAGLNLEQAEEVVGQIGRISVHDAPTSEIAELCRTLEDALAKGAEGGGALAARIIEAEKVESGEIITIGLGGKASSIILAISFLLLATNTGADFDLSFPHVHVDIHVRSGVPERFANILAEVAAIIAAAIGGPTEPPDAPSADGASKVTQNRQFSGNTTVTPEDAFTPQDEPPMHYVVSRASAAATWEEALATITPPQKSWLPWDDARDLAEKVFYALAASTAHASESPRGEIIAPGGDTVFAKDWRNPKRGKGRRKLLFEKTWSSAWGYRTPFIFAIGLIAKSHDRLNMDAEKFRLAVRVQSPKCLKGTIQDGIIRGFRRWGGDLPTIRFTAPAHLLSEDGEELAPWSGPKGPRFAIGAPVAISSGGVGAVTLFVKAEDGTTCAVTAGHVIRDGGAGKVGMPVFCPPQATAGDESYRGLIHQLTYLPRRSLLMRGMRMKTPDFAVIKLEPHVGPSQGAERMMANGVFHDGQIRVAPLRSGDKVYKVAARTRHASGIVRALNVYIEAQDMNGTVVCANDAVEIELDHRDYILRGDSGSLLYGVSESGSHEPVAMLVLGIRDGQLSNDKRKRSQIAYGLPLTGLASNLKPL